MFELLTRGKCGGWQLGHDGSEINQINTITVNVKYRIAPEGSTPSPTDEYKHLTLRGCYFTVGKTSQLECEGVEKCFENARKLLTLWREEHEKLFPGRPHSIPDPAQFDMHMVDQVVSDTAPQAKKLSCMIVALIREKKQQQLEESGEWDTLSEKEREQKLHTETQDCMHHMRDLVITKGAKAEVELMTTVLAPHMEDVSNRERLEVDVDTLLRSILKEFGTLEGSYAKGKGIKAFTPWMKQNFPHAVLVPSIRSVGSRQDYSVDAGAIEYHNYPYYFAFLKQAQYSEAQILEDSIYVRLGTPIFVAALRARAIVYDKISQRLRYLCNSNEVGPSFTHLHMGPFLDQLERLLLEVQKDGSVLMQEDLEVFEKEDDMDDAALAAVDALHKYEAYLNQREYKQVDETPVACYLQVIRSELYDPPEHSTNFQATHHTVALLQAWATGMLSGLRQNMGEYLTSQHGKNAWSNTSEETKRFAIGKDRTNNMCETMFAYFDYLYSKHPNFLIATVAGVTIAKKNKIFEDGGSWSSLTDEMQESLMSMVVHNWEDIMDDNKNAEHAQLEHNLTQRELARAAEQATAYTKYDTAWELFKRGLTDLPELEDICASAAHTKGFQMDALKHNIRCATAAYGWTNWAKPFSKKGDKSVGTKEDLLGFLRNVMVKDAGRDPPDKPIVAKPAKKQQRVLGEVTLQRKEQEAQAEHEDEATIRQQYSERSLDTQQTNREDLLSSGSAVARARAIVAARQSESTIRQQRRRILMSKLQLGTEITYRFAEEDGGWWTGRFYRQAAARDPQITDDGKTPLKGRLLFSYGEPRPHAHDVDQLLDDYNKDTQFGWHFGKDCKHCNDRDFPGMDQTDRPNFCVT